MNLRIGENNRGIIVGPSLNVDNHESSLRRRIGKMGEVHRFDVSIKFQRTALGIDDSRIVIPLDELPLYILLCEIRSSAPPDYMWLNQLYRIFRELELIPRSLVKI